MNDADSELAADTDWSGQTILVVDDDDVFREQLGRVLARRGLAVSTAGDYDDAMQVAGDTCPDLATVDLRMPGPGGLELVKDLAELCPDCEIVVLTGYGSIATAIDAVKLGAINYVQKPVDADDLLAAFDPRPTGADGTRRAFVRRAFARACRMGTYQSRAGGLRREYLGGCTPPGHPPTHVAAQAQHLPTRVVSAAGRPRPSLTRDACPGRTAR